MNPDVKQHWFELVFKHLRIGTDNPIPAHNIYGMDETGVTPTDNRYKKVVGAKDAKIQQHQTHVNREMITALVTICGNGSVLKPTYVFKGLKQQDGWGTNNIAGAS
jgi:hypothetical protein